MRKVRVIVLDDEEMILRLFREFFNGENYEIVTFSKAVACPIREAWMNSCPKDHTCADIFITDYKMPGMDGLEIINEQVRLGCAMDSRNKALITGMRDPVLKLEAEKLGCALFEKPFKFTEVKNWIDERARHIDPFMPLAPLRREPRSLAGREPAHVVEHTGRKLDAFVLNLSPSGLCLEIQSPLEKEGRVRIHRASTDSPRPATVRWIRENNDGLYLAGFHYLLQNGHQPAVSTA